jgi:hypothetical protein
MYAAMKAGDALWQSNTNLEPDSAILFHPSGSLSCYVLLFLALMENSVDFLILRLKTRNSPGRYPVLSAIIRFF